MFQNKIVLLRRNLTAVKFTAIKKQKYEEVLRQGVRDAETARNAAASVSRQRGEDRRAEHGGDVKGVHKGWRFRAGLFCFLQNRCFIFRGN